jgi:hypothetical protein
MIFYFLANNFLNACPIRLSINFLYYLNIFFNPNNKEKDGDINNKERKSEREKKA